MRRPWLYKLTNTRFGADQLGQDANPPHARSVELSLLTQRGWETTDYWDSRGVGPWTPEHGILHADLNTLMDKTDPMVEFIGFEKTPLFGGQSVQEHEIDKAHSCIPGGELMRHPAPTRELFDMSRVVVRYFLYQPKERT